MALIYQEKEIKWWDRKPSNHAFQLSSKHGVSLLGHTARMPDETDAQNILPAPLLENQIEIKS